MLFDIPVALPNLLGRAFLGIALEFLGLLAAFFLFAHDSLLTSGLAKDDLAASQMFVQPLRSSANLRSFGHRLLALFQDTLDPSHLQLERASFLVGEQEPDGLDVAWVKRGSVGDFLGWTTDSSQPQRVA